MKSGVCVLSYHCTPFLCSSWSALQCERCSSEFGWYRRAYYTRCLYTGIRYWGNGGVCVQVYLVLYMLWRRTKPGVQRNSNKPVAYKKTLDATSYNQWVIPCQINTKNGRPLWIFLKFGETNAYTEKLGHTKFLTHP